MQGKGKGKRGGYEGKKEGRRGGDEGGEKGRELRGPENIAHLIWPRQAIYMYCTPASLLTDRPVTKFIHGLILLNKSTMYLGLRLFWTWSAVKYMHEKCTLQHSIVTVC